MIIVSLAKPVVALILGMRNSATLGINWAGSNIAGDLIDNKHICDINRSVRLCHTSRILISIIVLKKYAPFFSCSNLAPNTNKLLGFVAVVCCPHYMIAKKYWFIRMNAVPRNESSRCFVIYYTTSVTGSRIFYINSRHKCCRKERHIHSIQFLFYCPIYWADIHRLFAVLWPCN